MDPLTIIASVTGILAVTTKVIATLTTFSKNVKRCPGSAHNVLREAADLHVCVSQVQPFILGNREAETPRMQLLMVEQLVVTLSNCVLTMSELDKLLDSLKINQAFTARSRLRWMREEQNIVELLARLQASKISLNLMMTTLTCSSVKEAHTSVANLVTTVNEVLESNNQLAWRIANMQLQLEGSGYHAPSTIRSPLPSINEASSTRSTKLLPWKPNNLTGHRPLSIGNFDQNLQRDLRESPVYARYYFRGSHKLRDSSAVQSLGWSFFSKCSLAAISNLSVLQLPIYSGDLWNFQCYQFSDDYNTEDVPSTDTASIVTAKTELDSLIDELQGHEKPDYRIALLGTNLGGNSTLLMLLYLSWSYEEANGSRLTNNTILQHVYTALVGVEELIKDHKLQVDSESFKLLQTIKSFRLGCSVASDKIFIERCQALCQDRDIRVAVEWECPTHLTPDWRKTQNHSPKLDAKHHEDLFLHQLELLLGHYTDSNKDILHMIHSKSGRYRTTLKLIGESDVSSIQITSITSSHAQLTRRTLAEVDHVFYVVPLCSYCQTLSDPFSQNQMEASLELFSLMTQLNIMRTTPITIFFTQADIFPQRIIDVPVNRYFPDYRYGTDAPAAFQYFASKFRSCGQRKVAQLHLFAPGLYGSSSLQDALNEVQGYILRDLQDRRQIEQDFGNDIGVAL